MTMPADGLRAFGPIIGRWATPGVVFDDRGAATRTIAGAEGYAWVEGGHWVVHRIDVVIVDQHSQGRALIGDCDAGTGRYRMRALDVSGSVSPMTALPRADGSWLLAGDGARAFLTPTGTGRAPMPVRWERPAGDHPGEWVHWMDVRFDPTGS